MRARFRPRRDLRVEVMRGYDFIRDIDAIRATDGVMGVLMPVPGELLADEAALPTLLAVVRDAFESQWARVVKPRSSRMRAAYDRRLRARRRRSRR